MSKTSWQVKKSWSTSEISSWTIGFDEIFENLEFFEPEEKQTSYPPFDIIKREENVYLLEIALAGFLKEEIELVWDSDDNYLTVRTIEERENLGGYLHKGIALREFDRGFLLAPNIRVAKARFENGILQVLLIKLPLATQPTRRVTIE